MTSTKRAPIGGAPTAPAKNRTPIRDRPDRAQIEFELATGKSVRAIAKKFDCHEGSLFKWRRRLPPQLKAAFVGRLLAPNVDLDKLRTEESEGLLQSLAQQRARLLIMQDGAMDDSNAQAVSSLAAQIHRNLELVGRYLGELQQHTRHTVVNVLVFSAEYLALRASIIRALAPYPEAKRAVAAAIGEIENVAARGASQPRLIDVTPLATTPATQ
jgi:transposase-like protein